MKRIDPTTLDFRFAAVEDEPFVKKWVSDERGADLFLPQGEKEVQFFVQVWNSLLRRQTAITMLHEGTPVAMAILYPMYYWKVNFAAYGILLMDLDYSFEDCMPTLLKNFKHLAGSYFQLDALYIELYGNPPRWAGYLEQAGFKLLFEQENYFQVQGRMLPRLFYEIRGLLHDITP